MRALESTQILGQPCEFQVPAHLSAPVAQGLLTQDLVWWHLSAHRHDLPRLPCFADCAGLGRAGRSSRERAPQRLQDLRTRIGSSRTSPLPVGESVIKY